MTRCKAPSDKLVALGRAASVAANLGAYDKARAFFDVALGGAVQEETLNSLEAIARTSDTEQKTDKLRRTLAEALDLLPFPDPALTLSEALQLAKGRTTAHRKLKEQIAAITGTRP